MAKSTLDRENWLTEAAHLILEERILDHCINAPQHPFRVSVGFPPRSRGGKTLAFCCVAEASADQHNEIFITPNLDDSIEVLAALAHELVHYSDNCESGHKNHFAKVARKIGLEGKLTSTHAGPALTEYLATVVEILGSIPHAALNLETAKPKQSTRMTKAQCVNNSCEFTYRTSQKQIDKLAGEYVCPVCAAPMDIG